MKLTKRLVPVLCAPLILSSGCSPGPTDDPTLNSNDSVGGSDGGEGESANAAGGDSSTGSGSSSGSGSSTGSGGSPGGGSSTGGNHAATGGSPATGGTGGSEGDPPTILYENPLDVASDLDAIKASLTADATDDLVALVMNPCQTTGCMSVLHDYDGQNKPDGKVNGEFAFGSSTTEATLRYQVLFETGFDFRKQGKLPGLIPSKPHFGGNKDDPAHPESWSARVMWLKTGDADADGTVKPDLYLYDQDREQGQTGEHNNRPDFSFLTNTWHTVVLYVRLNSAEGNRDGRAELWVDDELMACRTNKQFRGEISETTEIRRFAFHNYFGGGAGYDWPHEPMYSYFDDIVIFDGRVTPYVPSAGDCDSSVRND